MGSSDRVWGRFVWQFDWRGSMMTEYTYGALEILDDGRVTVFPTEKDGRFGPEGQTTELEEKDLVRFEPIQGSPRALEALRKRQESARNSA